MTLYVSKQGLVAEVLEEASKELRSVQLEIKSTKLRLLEVISHRIFDVYQAAKPIADLASNRTFRLEEIPSDQFHLEEDEGIIPVAHYSKEPHNTFGIPFLLKFKDGESLSSIIKKIQILLELSDQEMVKWKYALVHQVTQAKYLDEDEQLFLQNFTINKEKGVFFPHMGIPYLGLEHANKNQRRSRYSYLEKAIKIHN